MKRLLILTAVAMLACSAMGCRCCDWLFRRGEPCVPACPAPCQTYTPCDPCGSGCSTGVVPEAYPGPVQQ